MTTDPADQRFFQALQDACQRTEGLDNACRAAVDRAVQSLDPREMLAARRAVDGLNETLKLELMRQVHLRMATDLSAIWDALPGAPSKQRPN